MTFAIEFHKNKRDRTCKISYNHNYSQFKLIIVVLKYVINSIKICLYSTPWLTNYAYNKCELLNNTGKISF